MRSRRDYLILAIVIYIQLIYVRAFCFVSAVLDIMLYFEVCERKPILPSIPLHDSKQAMDCVLTFDVKATNECATCTLAEHRGDRLSRATALQQLFVEAIVGQPLYCKLP